MFVGLIYFVGSTLMSQYGLWLERRLSHAAQSRGCIADQGAEYSGACLSSCAADDRVSSVKRIHRCAGSASVASRATAGSRCASGKRDPSLRSDDNRPDPRSQWYDRPTSRVDPAPRDRRPVGSTPPNESCDTSAALLTIAGVVSGVLALAAFRQAQKTRFTEIDVERINVVEKDGKLRLTISNAARLPDPIIGGKSYPLRGGTGAGSAGMIFFNDEGNENGGLVFAGRKTATGYRANGHLTFDQFDQDETVSFTYSDVDGRVTRGAHHRGPLDHADQDLRRQRHGVSGAARWTREDATTPAAARFADRRGGQEHAARVRRQDA